MTITFTADNITDDFLKAIKSMARVANVKLTTKKEANLNILNYSEAKQDLEKILQSHRDKTAKIYSFDEAKSISDNYFNKKIAR